MGNTGIASANNSAALFYNPATLANITTSWMDVPAIQVIYSDEAREIYNEIQAGGFLSTKEDQLAFMEKYMGKRIYIQADWGINGFANLNKAGMTIGGNYLNERIYDYEVQNPATPEIVGFERYDLIRQAGFSYPVGLGQFVLGLDYKTIDRSEKSFVFTTEDALADESFPSPGVPGVNDAESGTGAGYDVGFLFRFANQFRVTMGGVWKKRIEFDNENVTTIPEEVSLGFSMTHSFGPFRWVGALDFRDITMNLGSQGEKSLNRRVHVGTEFSILPTSDGLYLVSLRGGYSQGYVSMGGELRLGTYFVAGVAQYTEETGEYAGEKENKRTAVYISLGF